MNLSYSNKNFDPSKLLYVSMEVHCMTKKKKKKEELKHKKETIFRCATSRIDPQLYEHNGN